MTPAKIGKNIKAAREARGLTQKRCASKLPCAQSTWCDWEHGVSAPRTKWWAGIARILGIRPEELIA